MAGDVTREAVRNAFQCFAAELTEGVGIRWRQLNIA